MVGAVMEGGGGKDVKTLVGVGVGTDKRMSSVEEVTEKDRMRIGKSVFGSILKFFGQCPRRKNGMSVPMQHILLINTTTNPLLKLQ